MKKERPILFNTEMVQAIEKRIKNQTRRTKGLERVNINPDEWEFVRIDGMDGFHFKNKKATNMYQVEFCPYGVPGDILWVRESFMKDDEGEYFYKALFSKSDQEYFKGSFKPSIHMPKEACRFKLEIVSLSVERLCDISDQDALLEGIDNFTWKNMATPQNYLDYSDPNGPPLFSPYDSFISLWDSINGQESTDSNPWVWRIQFKIVLHKLK